MSAAARLMPPTVAEPQGELDRDRVPPDQGEPGPVPARWPGPGFERSLVLSRSVALIPVVVLTLAATGAFVYGAALFVHSAAEIIGNPFPVGDKIGLFLLVVDLFLVGATMLIAAIGFYELFVNHASADRQHGLPTWLVMRDLDDLKARVVSMLVLVAAELHQRGSGLPRRPRHPLPWKRGSAGYRRAYPVLAPRHRPDGQTEVMRCL